jgi:hypothetical protein
MLVDGGLCQRRVPYQYYYAWKRELQGPRDSVIFKISLDFFDISLCATVTHLFFAPHAIFKILSCTIVTQSFCHSDLSIFATLPQPFCYSARSFLDFIRAPL